MKMTIREARALTGMGFHDIKRGMDKMETRDPLLGACHAIVSGYAVAIKGDREAWNRRAALSEHLRIRDAYLEVLKDGILNMNDDELT
jgi:hypothetical protein